tara:strand:- start:2453 stop:3505 length:1053 start_codon:yes stop_codon:yes gene_type:complete
VIFFCAFFEGEHKNSEPSSIDFPLKVVIAIWLLSFVSILNQIYIISELGGIVNYIGNIAYRVEFFKGRGYVIVLNNLIAIMNVAYFTIIVASKNRTFKHKIFFFLHFTFFVCIALLSGSRSFLLVTVLVEILIFHYMYRKFSILKLTPFIAGIIFLVALLGGIRNSVSTAEGEIRVKNEGEFSMEVTHFKYGLIPLEIILNYEEVVEYHLGSTYLSLFTNFIPRAVFPDKLDSGGIVFTKEYTGNQWGGLSNLATGSVTEGIINFGYSFGVVVGIAFLAFFMLLGVKVYGNINKVINGKNSVFILPLYLYLILAFARLSYSEFSYTFYTYTIYYFIPIFMIYFLSRLKIK